MYVLNEVLNKRFLALLFSIFVIIASFGIGSMIQSNAMYVSIKEVCNIDKYLIAFLVTIFCGYVVFGNEKRISNVSSILVPVATIIYFFMCICLLYILRKNLLSSIFLIIKEAFSLKSFTGGLSGIVAIKAMSAGLSKGLFSNEAGMGSSPLFNATVKMSNLKNEALISSTSVFIDTVILCTITGIMFVAGGIWNISNDAYFIVNETFSLIPYGKYLLSFSLTIFAIATIPCWSYYGKIALNYLFRNKENSKMRRYEKRYKMIYTFSVFIGTILTLDIVWSISSIANALMIFPNFVMLYKLKDNIKV